ncbi:MAG: asparagine synthase (glutamine-hydrolyzing) [Bacteroidota bacterium]
MCGITGVMAFNEIGRIHLIHLSNATAKLQHRGPDFQNTALFHNVGLGHTRLSIIDTSVESNQPFMDDSGRYHLIFNGEIYNYLEIRQQLEQLGHQFRTSGDTEVLIKAFIQWDKDCLEKLNGFFAFAIYDSEKEEVFIARDRLGIKPLLYFQDEDKFIFGSELRAVLDYGIPKTIDQTALFTYLQLNYTPAPLTMIEGVKKLSPGHYIRVRKGDVNISSYYSLPSPTGTIDDYEQAKTELFSLLEESVKSRLVSDVPIGSFLSGGIDSSIIAGLAARYKPDLNTFSIGFKDQPYFDETSYAQLVADHFGTEHHVFSITSHDMLSAVEDILDSIDEPFADSSAIPVHMLCKETRKLSTVALSGDGADEIFSGYNKHAAWIRSLSSNPVNSLISSLLPIWKVMPKSRSGALVNLFRQLERFGAGLRLDPKERYWRWASITDTAEVSSWLAQQLEDEGRFREIKNDYLSALDQPDIGHFLHSDARLVLPNDMLTKVDMMSMANSLEVRVPFLDHQVVDFAFRLSDDFKINGDMRKRILQDTFRDFLPEKLYKRPKRGFEVPLLSWLRNDLNSTVSKTLFDKEFLQEQGLFNPTAIMKLGKKIKTHNPGDSHAQVWALFVFQHWYRRVVG